MVGLATIFCDDEDELNWYICTAPTETPNQPIATIANYLTYSKTRCFLPFLTGNNRWEQPILFFCNNLFRENEIASTFLKTQGKADRISISYKKMNS